MIMYNKTIWNSGDIISSAKWNNLLQNSSFDFKVHQVTYTTNTVSSTTYYTFDVTIDEISNLLDSGYICYFIVSQSSSTSIVLINSYDSNTFYFNSSIHLSFDHTDETTGKLVFSYGAPK